MGFIAASLWGTKLHIGVHTTCIFTLFDIDISKSTAKCTYITVFWFGFGCSFTVIKFLNKYI